MLGGTEAFDQSLADWDVSSVTNRDGMLRFSNYDSDSIGGWDVSSVTIFYRMFEDTTRFNGDISGTRESKASNMIKSNNEVFQDGTLV